MDKISVEEKAKAYDKAIEKLRSLHDNYDTVSTLIDIKEELEDIFTEIAESKDEKVKKSLIRLVKAFYDVNFPTPEGFSRKDLLDWINKQSEQKPAEWSEEDETGLTNTIIMLKEGASLHFNKKDITKAVDWLKSLKDRIQPQPKQEWSEEDGMMLQYAIEHFERQKRNCIEGGSRKKAMQEFIDWLKSLKDRVQPKQEWSEEDEEMIYSIIGNIKYLYSIGSCDNATVDMKVNWLKSLRPRSTWKPSKEQMNGLKEAIEFLGCTKTRREQLQSLYEQLKKLREE